MIAFYTRSIFNSLIINANYSGLMYVRISRFCKWVIIGSVTVISSFSGGIIGTVSHCGQFLKCLMALFFQEVPLRAYLYFLSTHEFREERKLIPRAKSPTDVVESGFMSFILLLSLQVFCV